MISAEPENMPEHVQFHESVVITDGEKVENWLKRIEDMMVNSLRAHLVRCNTDYTNNITEREAWMFHDYPS